MVIIIFEKKNYRAESVIKIIYLVWNLSYKALSGFKNLMSLDKFNSQTPDYQYLKIKNL